MTSSRSSWPNGSGARYGLTLPWAGTYDYIAPCKE
jgi:hypothetical protein